MLSYFNFVIYLAILSHDELMSQKPTFSSATSY